jgi:arabinose-5-phosphate isomerase
MTSFIQTGIRTVDIEQQALNRVRENIGKEFEKACELMLHCTGRVVITGMGKSGHIGKKIAATLASTGTPSFFVHPGEASHGDMGMITGDDVVLALSNSGETGEVLTLLPLFKRMGAKLIAMTGNPNSTLATEADVSLDAGVEAEACPLDLAPTASTTAALVLGDALACAILEARGFTAEEFAFSHPGGSLGRRLLLRISDVMNSGAEIPFVGPEASIADALVEMTRVNLGMTAVVDTDNKVLGVFTDGDLRRVLEQNINVRTDAVSTVMTSPCRTVQPGQLAAEALQIMDEKAINALPVVNQQKQLVGAINMHLLLRAGVV